MKTAAELGLTEQELAEQLLIVDEIIKEIIVEEKLRECEYCCEIAECVDEPLGKICPKCIKRREERIKRIKEIMRGNDEPQTSNS